MEQSQISPDRILRIRGVLEKVPFGQSKIYEMVAAGEFPAPVRIGSRSVAWRESEIDAWIASRPVITRKPYRRSRDTGAAA
ncbi:helix-turn-helix transcriptional regulator [Hyphomicrobium sp. DY-1]|uniref:helix-turn-helix transcriptional regulator n=1 Tax=Hyphomicrobium sp. DY-1 TaxID=3075650 RepID=UPI0039C3A4A9